MWVTFQPRARLRPGLFPCSLSPTSSLLFPLVLPREFVVNVLLEEVCIGAHDAAAILEHRWRAVFVELLAICAAGVHGGGGFGAGHATLECFSLESRLTRIVHHFGPGSRRRNDVLIVVNQVIHLPEGLGVLLVSAAAGNGGGAGPGVQRRDRKVLAGQATLSLYL